MTLDEAIEERLKVIKVQEKLYEESYSDKSKEIIKNATDSDRQLVEWLRELKELREENKVLMQECDRLIKEKGELLSKVSGGDVLRICRLEDQLQVELDNSHCLEIELKEAKELLKLTIDTNYSLHKSCYNCSHFTSDRNCDIGKYLYGMGEKECEWEWKHMGEIINFLHD